MTWFRVGGGSGIPATLKNRMNAVLNKKFGTAVDYAPNTWPEEVNLLGALEEKTIASSPIAVIEDGADDVPTKSVKIAIPASLSGVSTVSEVQTGRNLLPNKTYQRNANTLRLGTDTLDGRLSLKASTYMLSLTSDVVIGSLVYTIGGTSTSITFTSSGTRYYGSFTLSADTDDIFIHVYKSGGITAENVSDFMLEFGSTAHSYEPYTEPKTYSANLGRTVYGGEVDIVNGVGQEDCSMPIALNSLAWNKTTIGGHDCFYANLLNGYIGAEGLVGDCDSYDITTDGQMGTDSTIRFYNSTSFNFSRVSIRDDQYASYTGAQFKEVVTGNIVYQLADSARTDFTFTGQEVPTRLGYNCFISEQGDTSVAYRASGTIYNYPVGEEASF